MFSNNYEIMKSNYETIKEFCIKYRNELTISGGVFAEVRNMITCEDYVKFMNGLSDETFVGNFLNGLLNGYCIDAYRDVLKGKVTIDEFIEDVYNKEIFDAYRKKMELFKD